MRKVHSDKIKCQAIGWWTKYPAFSHDDSKVTCRYCLNALRSQRIKETDPENFYRRYDYGFIYLPVLRKADMVQNIRRKTHPACSSRQVQSCDKRELLLLEKRFKIWRESR